MDFLLGNIFRWDVSPYSPLGLLSILINVCLAKFGGFSCKAANIGHGWCIVCWCQSLEMSTVNLRVAGSVGCKYARHWSLVISCCWHVGGHYQPCPLPLLYTFV